MINDELDYTNARMLRAKAEEKLKDNKQNTIAPVVPEADIKKLLHELQVHQIELEMQNEELRQAYATSETALKKYTMLYDFAPMGYFTLDSNGMISDLNFTGAEMLGERRFSLINASFRSFVVDESKQVFNDFFQKISTGDTKESCRVTLGYNNIPTTAVYIEGIATGDDRKCLLSAVDISGF
jgi:PAS domain-containing protein